MRSSRFLPKLFLSILSAIAVNVTPASALPVYGQVVDGWTLVPVENAVVTVREPGEADIVCVTGDDGRFDIGWMENAEIPLAIEVIVEAAAGGFLPYAEVSITPTNPDTGAPACASIG